MNLDSLIAGMRKDTLFANLGIIPEKASKYNGFRPRESIGCGMMYSRGLMKGQLTGMNEP